jgi:hypothetical protein
MPNRRSNLTPTATERADLERLERGAATPARVRRRARAMLALAQGRMGVEVARQNGYTAVQLSRLRRRFVAEGVAGLWDKPRSGRPLVMPDTMVADVLGVALRTSDTRKLARLVKISRNTIDRLLRAHGLLPPPGNRGQIERDPSSIFEIAGLYIDPPINAAAIAEGHPLGEDYEIHWSALPRLQEALSVANISSAVFQLRPRTTQLWKFLRRVVFAQYGQNVHLILDREAPTIGFERLRSHSRVFLHPTPKSLSWLATLKIWLDTLPSQSVCWTSSASVETAIGAIARHLQRRQANSKPFSWTKEPPLAIKYSADYETYRDEYGKF